MYAILYTFFCLYGTMFNMKKTINLMVEKIKSILQDNFMSFYLYGSVVSKDYRHGWSDIDFICFTNKPIEEPVAEQLLMLRQEMLKVYPKNKYFRKFEGVFISLDAYLSNKQEKIVYWGTSGQKIKDGHNMDVFAKYELKHVNQCELNENIGFNMDKALRFVEFQSPDIVYLEGIKTREAFEFLSELFYNDKTIITEFMANNMTDLRQKLAYDDFQSFKTLISCLVFIHSRNSVEVFDKSTLQKYLA